MLLLRTVLSEAAFGGPKLTTPEGAKEKVSEAAD
jgi:hypothetical protein